MPLHTVNPEWTASLKADTKCFKLNNQPSNAFTGTMFTKIQCLTVGNITAFYAGQQRLSAKGVEVLAKLVRQGFLRI